MIPHKSIIAASLHLEPNRAAILRDIHRAAARGIRHVVVNENMVALAMAEVQSANLDVSVSGIVGYPIGQWMWPAKKVALDELSQIQNGPLAVMHGVGPWLDSTDQSAAELKGIADLNGAVWVMTSLSAIPEERLKALADDVAHCGAEVLILSNGVAASGLPLPDAKQISALAQHAGGRFALASMAPAGTPAETIATWLKAGADTVLCTDFWDLSASASDTGKESS